MTPGVKETSSTHTRSARAGHFRLRRVDAVAADAPSLARGRYSIPKEGPSAGRPPLSC